MPTLDIEKKLSLIHPTLISALYLFNPFTVLSCISRSTIIFSNLSVIMALFWSLLGKKKNHHHHYYLCKIIFIYLFIRLLACIENEQFAMIWIALATYLSVYPAMLVPALYLLLPSHKRVILKK